MYRLHVLKATCLKIPITSLTTLFAITQVLYWNMIPRKDVFVSIEIIYNEYIVLFSNDPIIIVLIKAFIIISLAVKCPMPEKKMDTSFWFKGDIVGTTNYSFTGEGLEYTNVMEYSCPEG